MSILCPFLLKCICIWCNMHNRCLLNWFNKPTYLSHFTVGKKKSKLSKNGNLQVLFEQKRSWLKLENSSETSSRPAGTRGKLTREFLLSPQIGRSGAELPHQDDPLLEEEEVGSRLQKHNMRYMEEEASEFGCRLPSSRSVSPSFSFRLLVWCLIMSGWVWKGPSQRRAAENSVFILRWTRPLTFQLFVFQQNTEPHQRPLCLSVV